MQVVANIFQYQKCSCGTASSVSIPVSIPVSSIISFGSVTASRMGVESSAEWPPPCNCCNWPFLFWLAFLLIDPAVWLYTCPLHSHDLQLEEQQYIIILIYCNAGKYTVWYDINTFCYSSIILKYINYRRNGSNDFFLNLTYLLCLCITIPQQHQVQYIDIAKYNIVAALFASIYQSLTH